MTDTTTMTDDEVLEQAAAGCGMQSLLPSYRTLLHRGFALGDVIARMRSLRDLADRPVERIDT